MNDKDFLVLAEQIGQIKKSIEDLKARPVSELENIILNSDYKVLLFHGVSDGTELTPAFNPTIVQDKKLLIKSVKLIPYANGASDVFWNDTAGDHFNVPDDARLINVVDTFILATTTINVSVNGNNINLFPFLATTGHPMDLFVDNIYFNFKYLVNSIAVRIDGQVVTDLDVGTTGTVNIKVLIECYLY